jgi:hypothetical protein
VTDWGQRQAKGEPYDRRDKDMTVEFTARFDDSLSDYVKEIVGEEVGDIAEKVDEAISDKFSGYADPTDYFDMSDFVTDDDALTDSAVTELIDERLRETGVTSMSLEMKQVNDTLDTLATTLQAITDALVANGFVPTGWQAIPKREEVA